MTDMDKKQLTKELNDFFQLELNWEKMSKADLQALYDTLADDKKVKMIFGLDKLQQPPATASTPVRKGGIGSNLPTIGGLLDGAVEGAARDLGDGVKGTIDAVLEEKPLRRAIQERLGLLRRGSD